MRWLQLSSVAQIDHLSQRSHQVPCLIFKHSSRCSISSIAQMRLERDWDFSGIVPEAYFLDLIAHRSASNAVAEHFSVHHESPQVLLIWKGECILEASHLDISVQEVEEAMQFALSDEVQSR